MNEGEVVLFLDEVIAIAEGRSKIKDYDCWLMLTTAIDPVNNPLANEIPELNNYKKGGIHVGKTIITITKSHTFNYGWKPSNKCKWFQSKWLSDNKIKLSDYKNKIPTPQVVEWAIMYDKYTLTPFAYINLGGQFDLGYGDLTIDLNAYPKLLLWARFKIWLYNKTI